MSGFPDNVPKRLQKSYAEQGILKLFEWQRHCLMNERIFAPHFENLVYTAPTSAGKTLVAEVIAACNILSTGRRALFISPYISSARERFFYLQSLWRPLHIIVKSFIGASSSSMHGWSAAVCTIEKANSLLNCFIETNTIEEIGLIVVDELHMLLDNERGVVLENIISKILYATRHKETPIQIIGMSATLNEFEKIAKWIGAETFVTQFRPLSLCEFVLIEKTIYDQKTMEKVRSMNEEYIIRADAKGFLGMCMEGTMEEKATLVFCSTKSDVERNALAISRYLQYMLNKGENNRFKKLNAILKPPLQKQISEYFARKTFCTDKDLLGCISFGVAFHHAGLTVEEREEIELLFRSGNLKILLATSTLSSGVNLPAHRVLIYTNATSYIPLTSITYKQMVGRAGRQGQGDVVSGESYIICSKADWPIIKNQIERKTEFCFNRSAVRIILEAISSEFVKTIDEIKQLLACTFSQTCENMRKELSNLCELKLIAFLEANDEISPTQLGRAILASSLTPFGALQIFNDLEIGMRSLCLDSELHMLYLVTPIDNLAINAKAIDWNFYHQLWTKLPEKLGRVAKLVGITEIYFMQKLGGKISLKDENEISKVHVRFFATLVLHELINEASITSISKKFRINRGLLQSLQQQAATYAYMIVSFCDRLGFFYLKTLLEGFAERLQFGVRRDLTELVQIGGIDAIRARAFHQNGIKSLLVLANSSAETICHILRKAVPFPSNIQVVEQNKNTWLFGEFPMEDLKAAKLLIERAVTAINEKLEAIALPGFLKKSSLNEKPSKIGNNSTSFMTNEWLSDDTSLLLLEHQKNVEKLCETLSPMQIIDKNSEIQPKFEFFSTIPSNNTNKDIPASTISPNDENIPASTIPLKNNNKELSQINIAEEILPLKNIQQNLDSGFSSLASTQNSQATIGANSNNMPKKLNESIVENSLDDSLFDALKIEEQELTPEQQKMTPLKSKNVKIGDFKRPQQKVLKKSWSEHFSKGLTPSKTLLVSPMPKKCYRKSFNAAELEKSIKIVCACERENFFTNIKICGMCLGAENNGIYCANETEFFIIPLKKGNTSCNKCETKNLEEFLVEILLSSAITKWCLDAMEFLRQIRTIFGVLKFTCKPKNMGCIRTLDSITFELSNEVSLKQTIRQISKRYNTPEWVLKCLNEGPTSINTSYLIDAYLTYSIAETILRMANARRKKLIALYLQSLDVLAAIELNGIRFDKPKCEAIQKFIMHKMTKLEESIFEESGGEKFNLNKASEISRILFVKLNLPAPKNATCTKRHLSTNNSILKQIKHPICELIIRWRQFENALRGLEGLSEAYAINNPIYKDFRLRTCYCNYGAVAGRISSSNPNFHFLPKEHYFGANSTRSVFVAPDGYVLLAGDYCQLELRILCQLSTDKKLADLLNSNKNAIDPFEQMANLFENFDTTTKTTTSITRDKAKQISYAIIYGMGAESLSHEMGILKEDAQILINRFFELFPKVQSWLEMKAEASKENLYAETFMGRRRSFASVMNATTIKDKNRISRQAVNFIIQGTASEMFRLALIESSRRLEEYSAKIILQFHDEIIVETPIEWVNECAQILKNAMETAIPEFHRLNFPIKLSAGSNWGSLTQEYFKN